ICGTFLAWAVERTNTPLAKLIGMITLGRIIIPGVIITISWILSASASIGVLNYMINALTGVPRFLNIYSFWGMVWVQALEMTQIAYLLVSAPLQSPRCQLYDQRAHRCAAVPQYLFLLGHGLGASAGNDPARLSADVRRDA